MKTAIVRIVFSFFFFAAGFAQSPPASQIELNGFLLGQYNEAADGTFGKPTQEEKTNEGGFYRAYVFDNAHNGYMAFKYLASNKERMYSIQVSGDPGTQIKPFMGVRLGDKVDQLISSFGKPSSIKHETDYPVDLYDYADRNYSFEVNRQGELTSIELSGFNGFAKEPPHNGLIPDIQSLRKAVTGKDIESLLTELSGAMEIHRDGKMYSFRKAARIELSDKSADTTRLLLEDERSVRAAFSTETFEPDPQIRLVEKSAPQSVFKFEHSKILQEIVFKFEAGRWKVWEIQFR